MSPIRPFLLLLLGVVAATAQAPNTPAIPGLPPGVPVPGEAPAPPAGEPAAAVAAAGPRGPDVVIGDTKIVTDIVEPKLSGTALAGLYRLYTGRRVIVSSAAAAAEFSFVQDANPQDPLTYREASELLKVAALLENFVFVPHSTNPELDILTLATGGIRPPAIGLDVYTETDALPDGDAVISYVMSLSYIKPDEAVRTFTQIIGQFGAFGSIAAVPNASSVIITENTSLIRKLIELKKEIDKPSSQVGTRFIPVRFADVTELATTLSELLSAQQQAQTTAGIQRADAPAAAVEGGAPAVPGQAGSSSSGESTPVQIIPDPRTSRIFAMGRPVDLLFVEALVREFDTETDNRTFLRRKLKFLTVTGFLPVAEQALTRAFSGTGDGGSGSQASGGARPTATSNQQSTGRQNNTQTGGFGAGGASSSFGGQGGGGSSATRGSALSDPGISSAPESILVGRTLLVADNITNSIIVQGPPSGIEIIERLLDQLDVKSDQVMISTVFGQLTLGNGIETGVDYIVQSKDIVGRGGAGLFPNLPIVAPVVPPADGFPGQLPGGAGLRVYGTTGDLSIYLRALQTNSNFTVLSRPSIFTTNNQKGTISSGRRIAVPTSSNQFNSSFSTNIEYRDVVLKLEVIPLINDEKTITMQIALVSDDVLGSSPIEGVGDVPIIGTREILTTVTVPNNETVILGGLITVNDEESVSGIPILSSIPGIGRLFSSKSKTKNRDELMVFIQPSIVNNQTSLDDVQADFDARYQVSDDARNFADGPGVLPPPDAIQPVVEKGQGNVRRSAAPQSTIEIETQTESIVRPSLRPIHRR